MSTSVLCFVVLIACEQALMHLQDIVKSTRASGDATAMGGQRKMKLLFTASRSPPLARASSRGSLRLSKWRTCSQALVLNLC